ncbi:MAG: YciI family protein [Candidatus Velthaea sp.]
MRFLVMVKADKEWNGELPTAEMGAFNETLIRDGVLLAAEGLHPSSKGARISYVNRRVVVTDGPFSETKELVAGFWLLQARSKEELIERLSHCPFEHGESVEIRQIFEAEDFAGNEAIMNRLRTSAYKPQNVSETPNAKP